MDVAKQLAQMKYQIDRLVSDRESDKNTHRDVHIKMDRDREAAETIIHARIDKQRKIIDRILWVLAWLLGGVAAFKFLIENHK